MTQVDKLTQYKQLVHTNLKGACRGAGESFVQFVA